VHCTSEPSSLFILHNPESMKRVLRRNSLTGTERDLLCRTFHTVPCNKQGGTERCFNDTLLLLLFARLAQVNSSRFSTAYRVLQGSWDRRASRGVTFSLAAILSTLWLPYFGEAQCLVVSSGCIAAVLSNRFLSRGYLSELRAFSPLLLLQNIAPTVGKTATEWNRFESTF
jgi:hypothetical protein